jgi:hypothetical protein
MAPTDSPGGTGLRFFAQEGPMRFRTFCTLAFAACCLAACGGTATPTVAPVPSAGALPLLASSTPGATVTVAVPAPARTADAQTASPSVGLATPTPLARPLPTVGTRTPDAAATPHPTTAPPAASAAARTAQPNASSPPQKAARTTTIPGVSPQQTLGTAQDGLVLLNVRVGKDNGFTRVVFDLAKQDGSAAPVPQTRLWRDGETIVVAFGGVRDDVFGQSLGGGEQAINTGAVQSVYRIPVRDDSSAAYGIAVHGGAKATLSSASSPTRVIVDIADE